MPNLGNYIKCYTIVSTQRSLHCDLVVWFVKGLEGFQWTGNYAK